MGHVGLLLVGSVLFVNGLASLGYLSARSAAPLNFLVGAFQVVLPTLIMVQAGGDLTIIDAAWPSYLFGITYLWWGVIGVTGMDATGFGWYSLFVVLVAAYQGFAAFLSDPVTSAMWFTWALMWGMFFVLLGLKRDSVRGFDLGRFTGWLLVLLGIPSCTFTGILLLNGVWIATPVGGAVAFGVVLLGVVFAVGLASWTRVSSARLGSSAPATAPSV